MKKIVVIVSAVFLISQFSFSEKNYSSNFSLFVQGGLSLIPQSGSESDYLPGYNHFPVIPAHNDFSYGGSVNIRIIKNFGIELGGNVNKGREVTLIDPGDQDELTYKTLNFSNGYMSVFFDFTRSWLVPYITVGGGVHHRPSRAEKIATTLYGYKVKLEGVPEITSFVYRGSVGIKIYLFKKFALRFEGAYLYISEEKDDIFMIKGGFHLF